MHKNNNVLNHITYFLCTVVYLIGSNNGVSYLQCYKSNGVLINFVIFKMYAISLVSGFSTENDLIFSARNVTMSRGDRVCLDVVIVDDNNIEYTERFNFYVRLSNGSYISDYYNKYTYITVIDNDGECTHHSILVL